MDSKGFKYVEKTEFNEDIIGAEFYVMKYVGGEAPSDNPPYHMDPDGMMGKASAKEIKSSSNISFFLSAKSLNLPNNSINALSPTS